MLKEKELSQDFRQAILVDWRIDLETIKGIIEKLAKSHDVQIGFKLDQIKSGGTFSSVVNDCLILHRPEYPSGHWGMCLSVRYEEKKAFINYHIIGVRKLFIGKEISEVEASHFKAFKEILDWFETVLMST